MDYFRFFESFLSSYSFSIMKISSIIATASSQSQYSYDCFIMSTVIVIWSSSLTSLILVNNFLSSSLLINFFWPRPFSLFMQMLFLCA